MSILLRPPVPEPLHGPKWERPPGNLDFRVTQDFYNVNPEFPVQHRALDLGNTRLGAPVTAPAAGKVLAEGYLKEPWSQSSTEFGTGNYGGICVAIDHGGGWYSLLAHLADSIVNAGQSVSAGQLLGHLGNTGSAQRQGGHVHWDLYLGRPTAAMSYAQRVALKVDPWPLLRQNATLPDTGTTTPEADDMRFSGSEIAYHDVLRWRVSGAAGANLRTARSLSAPILTKLPTGTEFTALPFTVDGEATAGTDQWLPALLYVGGAWQLGYFHRSVVDPQPLPAPVPDAGAIAQATQEATARTNQTWRDWLATAPKP